MSNDNYLQLLHVKAIKKQLELQGIASPCFPCPPVWSFGKVALADHMCGRETYHFRGRHNGHFMIGYGRNPKDYIRFPGAALLGVDGPRRDFPLKRALLVVLDVDAHKGETDAVLARNLVLSTLEGLFAQAYYEPSTSGSGWHIYIQIMFEEWKSCIGHIYWWYRHFAEYINDLCIYENIDCRLDSNIGGFPSAVEYQDDLPNTIHRSHSIKLPRFPNGLGDVLRFAHAPISLYQTIASLYPWESYKEIISRSEDQPHPPVPAGVIHKFRTPQMKWKKLTWEERLEEIRKIDDGFVRRREFTFAMLREYGPNITSTEVEEEYCDAGLARTRKSHHKREMQFGSILEFALKTYDPKKTKSKWNWNTAKEAITTFLAEVTNGQDLRWNKGDNKKRRMKVEKIATVFFVIRTLASQANNNIAKAAIRYIKKVAKDKCGMNLHVNEIQAALEYLQKQKAIRLISKGRGTGSSLWSLRETDENLRLDCRDASVTDSSMDEDSNAAA